MTGKKNLLLESYMHCAFGASVPKLNITLELTSDGDRYPLTSQLNHKIVYFRAITIQKNGSSPSQ